MERAILGEVALTAQLAEFSSDRRKAEGKCPNTSLVLAEPRGSSLKQLCDGKRDLLRIWVKILKELQFVSSEPVGTVTALRFYRSVTVRRSTDFTNSK